MSALKTSTMKQIHAKIAQKPVMKDVFDQQTVGTAYRPTVLPALYMIHVNNVSPVPHSEHQENVVVMKVFCIKLILIVVVSV